MNINTYKISNTKYLKINPEEHIHQDDCQFCTNFDIDYIDTKNNITIRFGYETISSFCYMRKLDMFQDLLNGTYTLNKTITHDIGFEANEYFANKRGPTKAAQYHWVSNSHKQICPYYNSWLYNDEKGRIIFEITPFYPWFYVTKKTHPEKIPYNEWIKDYKPTVKTIIPKKNLKQWIKQAQKLAEKYEVNF